MALVVKDRVKETTTTTGTGTVTLLGAASGYQAFSVIGNTNTTYYAIVDIVAGDWEVGIGTYSSTGPTLSRDTILESSSGGTAVSFAAGAKDVFCTYPAERSMYVDGTTITPATAATLPVVSGGTGATTLTGVLKGNGTGAVTASDVNLASEVTGVLAPANGGTGLSDPGTSGNALISDGTNWVSQAVPTPDEVLQPTNVSPADEATDISPTPTLTGSAYFSLYGIPMAAGQWQVSTVSDFATTVVDTGDVAGAAVSYNVPSGILSTSTEYYWRVRYKDENGNYSQYSIGTTFTTEAAFVPNIGEAFEGGFYAGTIVQGGSQYYVIVAPKASGESISQKYKTTNDDAPVATKTLNNGPAASASMDSSEYPAAQFCEGLTIGGFSDWYLPARDELELCYRNLKPTTGSNSKSDRLTSAYTYPEGNDLSADTTGVNRNSEPTGAAYTSGDPAQTSVTDFQTDNSEAFTSSAAYRSSSESTSDSAWIQYFSNGNQNDTLKSFGISVRAVRRVAV